MPIKLKCNNCNNIYFRKPFVAKRSRYCCKACYVKDMKGKRLPEKAYIERKKTLKGSSSSNWKGDNAGKIAIHMWLSGKYGKPKKCEHCKDENKKRYDWASKDHKYTRDINDYIRLCTSCHRKYDIKNNNYKIGYMKKHYSGEVRKVREEPDTYQMTQEEQNQYYDEHDCHLGRDSGCQTCEDFREIEEDNF